MNLEKANRLVNHMRKKYKGTDLQVVIKSSDRIISALFTFVMFSVLNITQSSKFDDAGFLIAGLMLFVFAIILGIYFSKLIKIRDYLVGSNTQSLEETETRANQRLHSIAGSARSE